MSSKSLSSQNSSGDFVEVNDVLTRLAKARIPSDVFDANAFSPFKYLDWDPRELNNWLEIVEDAVDALVNKYHKGFNTSTNTFTAILGSFTACQKHCVKVEEGTAEARRLIQNRQQKRLYALHTENMKLQYAVKIMDRVIEMASIPSAVKRYLDRRQYLHSVVLLNRAVIALFEDDLKDIGGLKDIHDRLLETRNHLSTTILDQIDSQIYSLQTKGMLRSFPSEDVIPDSEIGSDSAVKSSLEIDLSKRSEDIDASMHQLLSEEATPKYILCPDRDHTRYITLLVHALHRLQRLPAARTTLLKRIRPALKSIIETETNALKEKYAQTARTQMTLRQGSAWIYDIISELLGRIFTIFKEILQTHMTICRLLSELEDAVVSDEAYGIVRVWFEMQNEIWNTILSCLQSTGRTVMTANLRQDSPGNLPSWQTGTAQLSFSFADSSVTTVRISNPVAATPVPSDERETTQTWIPALPENILAVYRPVMEFIEYAKTLGVLQRKYQGDILYNLLHQYVNTSFIPRVRADSNIKVDSVFADAYAFNVHDSKRSTHGWVSVSAVEVSEVVERIMSDYALLPYDQNALQEIVISIMSRFLEHYRLKLQEISFGTYSASLVSDVNIIEILRRDPLYNRINIISQEEFFAQEKPIYHRLLNHLDRLDQGQLLLDAKQWVMIALLSESLLWILNRVHELTKTVFKLPDHIENGFKNLSEKCRFLLRIEIHCLCFYFLGGMISSNYVSRDDSSEAEKFVIDLTKSLLTAEESLSPILIPKGASTEHLFGTLPNLINLILIRNAAAMKDKLINRQGQSRILRNIFALQQNLAGLLPNQKVSLEPARQFWELLKESDLDAYINSHPTTYSAEDYQAVKSVYRNFKNAQSKARPSQFSDLP